jgi:hypothetical protein
MRSRRMPRCGGELPVDSGRGGWCLLRPQSGQSLIVGRLLRDGNNDDRVNNGRGRLSVRSL